MKSNVLSARLLRSICGMALVFATAAPSVVAKSATTKQKMEPQSAVPAHAYLGVGAESLPSALTSQLPNLIGDGSGVLVAEVASGSPADKAGLKKDDIIVSYDKQQLYSPEQLVKVLWNDKPDRQVTLKVVHGGKSEDVKVELGKRPAMSKQSAYYGSHPSMTMTPERSANEAQNEASWSSFDSLTLTRTEKDHYKAEIKYRDDQGKLQAHAFQGTREQIRKDINSEKDLPQNERQQLLRALAMSDEPIQEEFPFVQFVPRGVWWDFDQPQRQ